MRRFCLVIALSLFISGLSAQINKYGVPLIRSYSTQVTQGAEYNWSIIKDKTGVLYIGNDSKGILRYDGHSWSGIPVRNDPCIRVLGLSSDGVLYVGGSYEFGYVEPNVSGTPSYVSISSRFDIPAPDSAVSRLKSSSGVNQPVQIGEIYSMITSDSAVYFCGLESLFIYHPSKDSIEYINLRQFGLNQVVRMVCVNNRIILADNISGLYEFKDKKPVRLPGGEYFAMKICMVIMPYSTDGLFIGTLGDGVFRLDLNSGKVSDNVLEPRLNKMLMDAQIYTAVDLNSGERLLGTIGNGIIVLDRDYRLKGKWDNKTSDLLDNIITGFYTGSDPSSELWILTNGYVSRAYVGLPFTELSSRTGFEGGVNSIMEFDDAIYLSTDNGLFKSYNDVNGLRAFRRVGDINNQVFSLTSAQAGAEKFILAGSNQGIFKISRDEKVIKVDDIIVYPDNKQNSYYVRSLLQSGVKPERFYIGLNSKGILVIDYSGGVWKYVKQIASGIKGYVPSIIEDSDGDLFVFSGNPAGLFHIKANDTIPEEFTTSDGLPESSITGLSKVGRSMIITTGKGLYRYVEETHKWEPYNELLGGFTRDLMCRELIQDPEGDIWLTISDDRIYEILFRKDSLTLTPYMGPLNPLPNLDKMDFDFFDNRIWMAKSKSVFVIDKNKLLQKQEEISAMLSRIVIGTDSLMMNGTFYETLPDGRRIPTLVRSTAQIPAIKFNFNSISFFWTLPWFVDEEATHFSYKLDGFEKSWSKWEKTYYKDFTNLPFGKYIFRVKAKTATGIESKEAIYEFYILKPWYLKTIMIILYAISIILIILGIIKAYTRKLKNENIRLEGIVAERTAVVVKQKEELESSIHYASRIQMALLPSEAILSENLKNYFILFKPRDIVSGDFYWMTKKGNRLYIVAGDCTGHGVPGAFMSLLGMSFLDEIIDKEKEPRADYILSELRLHVTESLKQSGVDDEAKDGMDMALLVIDFNVSRVEFSGAYNPCFRVRKMSEEESKNYHDDNMEMADGSMSNGKYLLDTIYASKMPIGISSRMDEKFVFYDWDLEKGVTYYLFSDGYIDQFGGQQGRKFMKKNFKRYLLEIQDYPMNRQKELLDQNLRDWMGQSPQIDDILVMGIRTD